MTTKKHHDWEKELQEGMDDKRFHSEVGMRNGARIQVFDVSKLRKFIRQVRNDTLDFTLDFIIQIIGVKKWKKKEKAGSAGELCNATLDDLIQRIRQLKTPKK